MIGVSWSCQTLPRAGDEDNGEKDFFLLVEVQLANAKIGEGIQWERGEGRQNA